MHAMLADHGVQGAYSGTSVVDFSRRCTTGSTPLLTSESCVPSTFVRTLDLRVSKYKWE